MLFGSYSFEIQGSLLLAFVTIFGHDSVAHGSCLKPQLELLVTPPNNNSDRLVRVHWNFNETYDGVWIGIYSQDPGGVSSKYLLSEKIDPSKIPGMAMVGTTTTKLSFRITGDWMYDKPTYLGCTAVAWRINNGKEEAIVTTKFQTYPQWMKHYWKYIKDTPINELFLPGTHDTCSFLGDHSLSDESHSLAADLWSKLKKIPGCNEWSLTQNVTIKNQLISGIRYLDIRVKKSNKKYWASHSFVLMHLLSEIIEDVVDFVTNTEKEIVIFDVHVLEGIDLKSKNAEDETKFINFLKESMTKNNKPLYVSPNEVKSLWKATPEAILASGRIIVSYINEEFQQKNNLGILWPSVYQYWGNKQVMNDLRDYVYATIPGRISRNNFTDTLTSVMAELTGNMKRVIGHFEDGISVQATENAAEIHSWFIDPLVAKNANVVAMDYFENSGVVRLAFIWNERKFFKSDCDAKDTISDDYYQMVSIP